MTNIMSRQFATMSAIAILIITSFILSGGAVYCSGGTHASFALDSPNSGPFPSDRFTVIDDEQNTGFRVNLPSPDCAARPSECQDIAVINTLDGFNLQPRISIPFDGPIDVTTVTSSTVFLLKLGDLLETRRIGINQVVWDPGTRTLHVQSDELLDQHSRYILIVTRGVLDEAHSPIEASESFERFRHELNHGQSDIPNIKAYRKALLDGIAVARRAGTPEDEIVSASIFTTQSATSLVEKIRDQIKAGTPSPADFNLGAGGSRANFQLNDVSSISWRQQTRENPSAFTVSPINLALLRIIPGAVGQVAFGKYVSPDYMVHPGEYVPPVATRSGSPTVQGTRDVYFNLYLPAGPRPANGWPVVVAGHGSGSNKNNVGANIAASFAAQGIATIIINQSGHGFGPLGTMTVTKSGGATSTFPDGGRGFDQNHDGIIESREGDEAAAPRTLQLNRDGLVQTLADLMQLVRVIQVGVDADGDATADLDASRIYYFGASLGGMYATVLAAVEPDIRATVSNVAGGALIENRRLMTSAESFRARLSDLFAARTPSLLNAPGINRFAGVALPGTRFFDENMPLRDGLEFTVGLQDGTSRTIASPVVNTVAGAMELQQWFDRAAWAAQATNPVAYSPYLRRSPLPGVPVRPILFTFAKGDQSAPNPNTTAILRAGDLGDLAVFYRHDIAFAESPTLPKDPHLFTVGIANVALRPIALEAQRQAAIFLASGGATIIHPEPARYFEVPVTLPRQEGLNYIP